MMQKMMQKFPLFIGMGFMIVMIAVLIGAVNTANSAGSALVAANVVRHSIPTWVPSLKFMGLGIMLGAITMALGVIATTLRDLGTDVMSKWPAELRPGTPTKPHSAKMFPMLMMMGWMALLIGLIWAFALNGTVSSYWAHSIANELNPAAAGSALLQQLGVIKASLPWLAALRFLGMALVLSAITLALTVIIRTLQFQNNTLSNFVQTSSSASGD